MNNYSKYPICDTDIWVNLCLGDIEEKLFAKYLKVNFVDVVVAEICGWKSNEKFSHINDKFQKSQNEEKALVINICDKEKSDIEEEDRMIIEWQLKEDAGFPKGFDTPKKERKNMGEYLSAIVANHLKMPLMKTEDHLFKQNGKGRLLYPELEIKGWQDTICDLVDIGQREAIKIKVKNENMRMRKEKDEYENGQASMESIKSLAEKFNNKF